MREKRFTGTEWFSDGPAEFFPSIMSSQGDLIATVYHSDYDGEDNITQEQCEANANLISSAPELLEALENMSKQFAEEVVDGEYCANYQEAQIAINKACGETI